jgi:hypothetical protein
MLILIITVLYSVKYGEHVLERVLTTTFLQSTHFLTIFLKQLRQLVSSYQVHIVLRKILEKIKHLFDIDYIIEGS